MEFNFTIVYYDRDGNKTQQLTIQATGPKQAHDLAFAFCRDNESPVVKPAQSTLQTSSDADWGLFTKFIGELVGKPQRHIEEAFGSFRCEPVTILPVTMRYGFDVTFEIDGIEYWLDGLDLVECE